MNPFDNPRNILKKSPNLYLWWWQRLPILLVVISWISWSVFSLSPSFWSRQISAIVLLYCCRTYCTPDSAVVFYPLLKNFFLYPYLNILDFSHPFVADASMKNNKSKNVVIRLSEDFWLWSVKSSMEETGININFKKPHIYNSVNFNAWTFVLPSFKVKLITCNEKFAEMFIMMSKTWRILDILNWKQEDGWGVGSYHRLHTRVF